ncbi:hypothetical protein STRMOE7_00240 [Streptomyces sp. MOE7]|nr:hypothetical protein STRMOE7_00240 [Streptomyces sp. MOE7]
MIEAIERQGGVVPIRFGQGSCIVAESEGHVIGMVYAVPPVDWLGTFPSDRAAALAPRILQIELLAVDPDHRETGIGQRLLEAVEELVRKQRGYLAIGKVQAGAFATMRFYRRRGYSIAGRGEPIVFGTGRGPLGISDVDDGYHLFAKAVQPGTKLSRDPQNNCIFLTTAQHSLDRGGVEVKGTPRPTLSSSRVG